MYIPLINFAVFLLVGAAIFLVSGLDEKIAVKLRRGKKVGERKLRKQTLFTRLARLERERRRLVQEVNMPAAVYWLLTALGAGGGAAVGRLLFSHTFFAVAVGVLGALSPQLFLRIKLTQAKSQRVEKLHSSMLILSNSYIVTEDFIQSVRDNLGVLEYPTPFRDFLTYTNYIDGSVKTGLRRMEAQVENDYFSQWVNVLILAQDDRNMKYVTMSVVDAMADVRQVQRESDTAMYAIWREYFTVLALIFAAPLIFRVLMRDAYTVLVMTLPGQVLLTLLLVAVVFSLVRAYRLNKPLLT
ncbi:membrane hypothetical protein [uncultured Eubacteriales bacterium]|uniref:Flp pilus assembly protein TadB n=1 Tax=uncultured Eubacteriales bacterium TaxID=172733 RepID=A0A212JM87_9FIRM|nr:membrane hypothetical protein [uncultured Eubacteriales bacterium]